MGRKKKPHHSSTPRQAQREEAFHSPFRALQEELHTIRPAAPPQQPPTPAPPAAARPPVSRPGSAPAAKNGQGQRDRALFLAEMAGVERLAQDPRGYVSKRRQPVHRAPTFPGEVDGMSDLRDLVEGRSPFTIQFTDEYMEGVAPDVDLRLAQRLHQGDYAIQAHCDLHGHTVAEAKVVVTHFLTQAYKTGQRCILLVHGRGRNSRDNRPVLKEQVHFWLSHGRLSRLVLAFATAPVTNGGAGAVCVLLRRAPHKQKK